MVNAILTVLFTICIVMFAVIMFILANINVFIKEETMNVIEVTPDKNGKIFITLYGTRYEIVVKEPKKPAKAKETE